MMTKTKSEEMKIAAANKAKLQGLAREVYLRGFARLSKAKDVAERGNGGKGFVLPVFAKPEVK